MPEPYGSQGLFAETGEVWREHRHVLTPAFSASKMKLVCDNIIRYIPMITLMICFANI